jgi:hypothetical protein
MLVPPLLSLLLAVLAVLAPGATPSGSAARAPGTAGVAGDTAANGAPAATPGAALDHTAPPPVPALPEGAAAARLAAGEVLLSSHPAGPRSLAEEIGAGIIDAPPARVFAALIDFAHYQEWVPFVKQSDAHRAADGSILSFQSLDLPFPVSKRHYRIHAWSAAPGLAPRAARVARGTRAAEATGAAEAIAGTPGTAGMPAGSGGEAARVAAESPQVWRIWWAYVPHSGNVADHYGWWVLQPFGAGRTLGTCLLYTDPGGVPAWALHAGTAQTMPYIFSGLRQQIHRSRYD